MRILGLLHIIKWLIVIIITLLTFLFPTEKRIWILLIFPVGFEIVSIMLLITMKKSIDDCF